MLASNVEHETEQNLLRRIIDNVSRDDVHTIRNENYILFKKGYTGNRIIEISIKYQLDKPPHPESMRIEIKSSGVGQYGEFFEVNFNEDGSPDIKSYIKLDSRRKIQIPEEFPDEAGPQNQYYTTRSSLEGICEVLR